MEAFEVYEKVCTHQHISTEWLDRYARIKHTFGTWAFDHSIVVGAGL